MFFLFFGFFFLAAFTVIFILAPMPGRVAKKRNHPQYKAIRTCGWTAVLSSSPSAWVLSLMWAYKDPKEDSSDLEQQIKAAKKAKKRTLQSSNRY